MMNQGVNPDEVTYLGILSSCWHADLVKEGQDYLNSMIEYSSSPYLYQEEPPSYHEPSLQNNKPSYPPQAPIDDPLALLLQGQEAMKRDTLEITLPREAHCAVAQPIPLNLHLLPLAPSTIAAAAPPPPPRHLHRRRLAPTHPQPLFPSHHHPFSLSLSYSSQPRRDQAPRRRPVFTAGGALPPRPPSTSSFPPPLSFSSLQPHHRATPSANFATPLPSPPPLTAAQFLLLWPPAPEFPFHS
ncbi:hypothetical protein Ahy_B10g104959 [Arachis hypogaea]|uniref:Pentatricopeptide repeat-containing protein n=1 Tax=Arachis hypogaea TaxID=3818 RepID=A0A444X6S7_ARAHY|nr:hypothetical protein Ahy_B10g104959 [Arachis hypogaea]